MSRKPHSRSVTGTPCTCGYLVSAANDPDNPIRFIETTNEFEFVYTDPEPNCNRNATLIIYHCPFCGGAAPKSKRPTLFAQISRTEEARLKTLCQSLKSVEEVLNKFGPPSSEGHTSTRTPESKSKGPSIEHHRQLTYDNLSDTAIVVIIERTDGRIGWSYHGKYLGDTQNG